MGRLCDGLCLLGVLDVVGVMSVRGVGVGVNRKCSVHNPSVLLLSLVTRLSSLVSRLEGVGGEEQEYQAEA